MDESQQINFVIDEYQDLFSDFDSREYSRKSLSDDFLNECKKASIDKKLEGVELQILLPQKIRDEKKESIIKERLKNHFIKHYNRINDEKNNIIKKGVFLIALAVIVLACSTVAHYILTSNNTLLLSLFYVVFDPLGILLLWEGIEDSISGPNAIKEELDFYKKMSKSRIFFETLKNEEMINNGSKVI